VRPGAAWPPGARGSGSWLIVRGHVPGPGWIRHVRLRFQLGLVRKFAASVHRLRRPGRAEWLRRATWEGRGASAVLPPRFRCSPSDGVDPERMGRGGQAEAVDHPLLISCKLGFGALGLWRVDSQQYLARAVLRARLPFVAPASRGLGMDLAAVWEPIICAEAAEGWPCQSCARVACRIQHDGWA